MKRILALIMGIVFLFSTVVPVLASVPASLEALNEEDLTSEASCAITENLTLPNELADGTTVTYTSSNPSVISIDTVRNRGVVKRQATDTDVTITATTSNGSQKTFDFTVLNSNTKAYVSENCDKNSLWIPDSSGIVTVALNTETNGNSYANVTSSGTDSYAAAEYTFDTQNQPSGDVVFKTRILLDKLTTYGDDGRRLRINTTSGNDAAIIEFGWQNNSKIKFIDGTTLDVSDTYFNVTGTNVADWFDLTVAFNFVAGTYDVTIQSEGKNAYTKSDLALKGTHDANSKLKSLKFQYRDTANSSTASTGFDDMVVLGDLNTTAEATATSEMSVYFPLSNQMYVRTPFDETQDLLSYMYWLVNDEQNNILDFTSTYLKEKTDTTWALGDKKLASGGDERTPFNINGSYIGASHGHNSGVQVTTTAAHGKTYADIGSVWTDDDGTKWNLLKVIDNKNLLFLSDDTDTSPTDYSAYTFKADIKGDTLIYVSDGVNTDAISISARTKNIQILKSCTEPTRKMYTIVGDTRTEISPSSTPYACDLFEVEEEYQIINPATVAQALRDNRPSGNYTENVNLAVGTPMVNVKLLYRFLNDGTILTIMDHTILQDLNKVSYGGIQYFKRNDLYGGGVFRYIPKTKAFTTTMSTSTSTDMEFDFRTPYDYINNPVPNSINLESDYWEDDDNPPDREVHYYKDTEGNVKAAFAAGFLPIEDGRAEIRKETCAGRAFYLYKTNKGYPAFVYNQNMKQGETIKGVAYKKFMPIDSDGSYTSSYGITYNDETYYYTDYHKDATEKVFLPENYLVSSLEDNSAMSVLYADNIVGFTADITDDTPYGYSVLKAKSDADIAIKNGVYDDANGKVEAEICNVTSSKKTVDIYVALYKENALIEVVCNPDTELLTGVPVPLSLDISSVGADEAKIMIWDNETTLRPSCRLYQTQIISK